MAIILRLYLNNNLEFFKFQSHEGRKENENKRAKFIGLPFSFSIILTSFLEEHEKAELLSPIFCKVHFSNSVIS